MESSIPVIICGQRPEIAKSVKDGLEPEVEVIHVILTPDAGIAEIPAILRGEVPPASDPENIGSRDYSKRPVAVVPGRGYDDAQVNQMRAACAGTTGLAWLIADMTKPAPPIGPEYGKAIVARVKERLIELEKAGQLTGDGLYYY